GGPERLTRPPRGGPREPDPRPGDDPVLRRRVVGRAGGVAPRIRRRDLPAAPRGRRVGRGGRRERHVPPAGAGRRGGGAGPTPAPPPIWDAWTSREPLEQVRDAVATDAAFLEDA